MCVKKRPSSELFIAWMHYFQTCLNCQIYLDDVSFLNIKDYKYQSDDVGDVVFVFSGCRHHEEEAKLAVLGWPVKQEYGVVMMSGMSGYLSDFP